MTTKRRMPVLSPEEIRQISKKAVATVAADKIITNKTAIVNANIAGIVKSATSAEIVKAVNRAASNSNYVLATKLAEDHIKDLQKLNSTIKSIQKSGDVANIIKAAKASTEVTRTIKALEHTRMLAKSVLEQSSGRNLIQDSFNQVRKNKKG
ncbi:TPA: hypothetical protein QHK07_004574 [Klebsiella aerogenes]|nr:hypothetical protein [Klebsiella aerogenes]